jgi:transposase
VLEIGVAGCDAHKRKVTVGVVDERGRQLGVASFENTGAGHAAALAWMGSLGVRVERIGVEGSAGWGRQLSVAFARWGLDVREVNARRTAQGRQRRRRGKTDRVDALAIAKETLAEPDLPLAGPTMALEPGHEELVALCAHRSALVKRGKRLLNEAEGTFAKLAIELVEALPRSKGVKVRLNAVRRGALDGLAASRADAARVAWLHEIAADLVEVQRRVKHLECRLAVLVDEAGSTLAEEVGIAVVSAAELLAEVGDPTRFATESKFARWCGIACVPISSGEGDDEPDRHRLDLLGNRQVNRILHNISITQARCRHEPAADYLKRKRTEGKSSKEARRAHKRQLSNRIIRRMWTDHQRQRQLHASAA